MNIPLARPCVGEDEYASMKPFIDSGWLGMGGAVGDFENAICQYTGAKHTIAVNTGTSAIHLALEVVDVKGKEVIVPSMTYAATIQAILAAGGIPVFAEVNEHDLNLDIEDAISKVTENTKVILPVHYSGKPVEWDKLWDFASSKNLIVVEDAAHAFGSSYKDKKIGSMGDLTCFSFDPIKTITCGEGGAICTSRSEWADRMGHMRVLGISKNTWDRYKSARPWFYEVIDQGFRYHMSNLNAAIGLVQIKKVDHFIETRRAVVKQYDSAFKDLPGIKSLEHGENESASFCYTLRILDNRRNNFMSRMKEQGIGVSINYIPNHQQPFFKDFVKEELPKTERLAEEYVSIPLFSEMTDAEVDYVINNIVDFAK
jgi:perosamine synthetase